MNSEIIECPFCAEPIKFNAIKCKHCKSNLNTINDNRQGGDSHSHFEEEVTKNNREMGEAPLDNSHVTTKDDSLNTTTDSQIKVKSSHRVFFLILFIFILVLLLYFFSSSKNESDSSGNKSTASVQAVVDGLKNETSKNRKEFTLGEIVSTGYFQYKVIDFSFSNLIGNQFFNIKSGNGNKFLIIEVNIKNIDRESRFIDAGQVRVFYNGAWMKYETPEMVFTDDKFILFDNLNPLTSRQGLVAFKVPSELQGPFYWVPPRSDVLIKLSKINHSTSNTSLSNPTNNAKNSINLPNILLPHANKSFNGKWKLLLANDINSDGVLDYLLMTTDEENCGTTGCISAIFISDGNSFIEWDLQNIRNASISGKDVLITTHGNACNEPGFKSCVYRLQWDRGLQLIYLRTDNG
jgi:hypothetical protein